jgi:hypothetical protein
MPGPKIVDDSPPKSSLTRVDWFRREPGGGTLFVKPLDEQASPLVDDVVEAAETSTA